MQMKVPVRNFRRGSDALENAAGDPIVEAGGPYTGTVDTAIQLNATVTPGLDPSPTLLWEIVSGGTGTFSNATIEDPTFTPDGVAGYTLSLTATHTEGSPVVDSASLESTNVAPSVDAGGPYSGQATIAIPLNGTVLAGTDPNPALTWLVVSGPDTSSAQFSSTTIEDPTFTASTDGNYTLRLTANPNDGEAQSDDASLTASEAPAYSPEVQAVLDRMTALSQAEIDAVEAFVDGLVSDGIWASLDEFWCFALNATDYLTGWKSFTATLTGAISHNKDGAIVSDAISHLDTNIELTTLSNYQLTDAEAGVYVHTATDWGGGNHDVFGVEDGTTNRMRVRHRGSDNNDKRDSINSTATMTNALTIPAMNRSLCSIRATASDTLSLTDGVADPSTGGSAPVAIPTGFTVWLFRKNLAGSGGQNSRANTILTSFYIGAGIDTVQFLSRLNTLHTALGVTP